MSDKTSDRPDTSGAKLFGKLRQTIGNASDAAWEAARKGVEIGGQIAGAATQGTQDAVGKMQRMLGEDYYAILSGNPVVLDTLSRSPLLTGNQELLTTAFNVPWATTLLWSAAAGSVIALERPMAQALGDLVPSCISQSTWLWGRKGTRLPSSIQTALPFRCRLQQSRRSLAALAAAT